MDKRRLQNLLVTLILTALALGACNMPRASTPEPQDPDLLYTIAAQTVEAQLTQAAAQQQPDAQPPQPSTNPDEGQQPPLAEQPSHTSTETQQPPPPAEPSSATPTPSPTLTVIPCDQMSFVKDINVPDNTEFTPGEKFTKTWRLKNTGSCTWNSGYSLVFESGDGMGAPASVQLTTSTVAPEQEVDISVELTAPDEPGTYQGFFKLRNPGGVIFGWGAESKNFWVKIVVPDLSGVMFDFLARADEADWGSGIEPIDFVGPGDIELPYGGPDTDADGFALIQENVTLENGSTSAKILETHPKWEDDGYIIGRYPEYIVGAGDHLKGRLGFIALADGSCGVGDVIFEVYYTEGSDQDTRTRLGQWNETCDGTLRPIDVDLAALKGKTVRFYLLVLANGSASQDWAIWSSLGVMRE
jgi:hypothetical protein